MVRNAREACGEHGIHAQVIVVFNILWYINNILPQSKNLRHFNFSQLVKLSVFGSPGAGGRLGTECLWDIARKCNPR